MDIEFQLSLSLLIPKKLHAFIRKQATKKGQSNSEFIIKLLQKVK